MILDGKDVVSAVVERRSAGGPLMLLHTRSHVGYVVVPLWYFLGYCDDK